MPDDKTVMVIARRYLNSVPWTSSPPTLMLRITRFWCSLLNHYPRSYDGSWAWGYGYVCSRCGMYSDPWSAKKMAALAKQAGDTPDQELLAKLSGGGPTPRR